MFGNLFAPLAMKVAGGIVGALLIVIGLMWWNTAAISADRERLRNVLAAEKANHAVTRNSVDTLKASLAKMIGEGKAARIAQLAEIERQMVLSAELRERAGNIRAMIDEIEPGDPCDCSTPDFIMEGR